MIDAVAAHLRRHLPWATVVHGLDRARDVSGDFDGITIGLEAGTDPSLVLCGYWPAGKHDPPAFSCSISRALEGRWIRIDDAVYSSETMIPSAILDAPEGYDGLRLEMQPYFKTSLTPPAQEGA